MTQLLAMSFDNPSSPSIRLKTRKISKVPRRRGWGLAWYPSKDSAAAVVKDPESIGDNAMTKVLNEWKRFRSTVFVSHIVGAAQRRTQQDTHPFSRSYAGCSWVFAHNGTLERGYEKGLSLGEEPIYEPMGRTDSEHAFCWLMGELRQRKVRRLADLGWPELHKLFLKINQYGTTNLLLTDGQDLVAYRDKDAFRELYWIRRLPPHPELKIGNAQFSIDVNDALDVSRTMVLFSSSVLSKEEWNLLPPGEMIVARRGHIRWSSANVKDMAQPLSVSVALAGTALPTSIQSQVRQDSSVAQTEKEERILTALHETTYIYKDPVELSNHMLRLKPLNDENQELLDFSLEVSPDCMSIDFEDVFGNRVTRLEIEEDYTKWKVTARSKVRVKRAQSLRTYYPERMIIPLVWMPWQREMMQPYLLPPELAPSQLRELSEFALSFVERQDADLVETLLDMNKTIYRDFKYIPNSTNLETTPFEVYS
ncbi:MAG: class II glutamine amidotransferase [Planctomycetota bacterium]|nr:class II glutamine amidotransferase [Planctomycetota bacterium]